VTRFGVLFTVGILSAWVGQSACVGQPDSPGDPDEADASTAEGADARPGTPTADGGAPSADAAPDPNAPPANPFGIGLVGPGNATQWDRTAELAGPGGHIKLIFPGVDLDTTGAPQDWIDAVSQVYSRDLIPVIRLGPPWGDRNIRRLSDDSSHMSYTTLAARYAAVVAALPRRASWPLVIEIHNEANLCYEWECEAQNAPSHPDVPAGWIHYTHTAAEYAAFLRDVAAAIRAIGDDRIRIINGGLAPGGTVACECGGDGFTPGVTSREFLAAMEAAVPGVHASLDGFASHPYPAQGEGWGFFESYDSCGPGLHYFETELATLGIDKPVYITETGWTVGAGAQGSREQIAQWTLQAWQNDWFDNPKIKAVMPFMLQDGSWNDFAWIDGAGAPYPVFTAIRNWRCSMGFPRACP
jgi:hypothetical protein